MIVSVTDNRAADNSADSAADGTITVTVNLNNVDEGGTVTFDPGAPRASVALTASLEDPDGSVSVSSWAWHRLDGPDDASPTLISGATAAAYTPTDADMDKWLRATASYADGHGSAKTASGTTAAAVTGKGVTLSPTTVAVGEAGTAAYTVVLDAAPTGNVTVTPASGDTAAATVSTPATDNTLTFTTTNWDTPQSVTVAGVADDDADDETVTVSHTVSGGGYGSVSAGSVTVKVDDDESNAAPAFDDGARTTRRVAENSPATTSVGSPVAATDPEGDTLVYALEGADAGLFVIDASTGQITVKSGTTLDFEARKNAYAVVVTVHDGADSAGGADTSVDDRIAVTVRVTDVNEAPSFDDGATAARSVDENSPAGTDVGAAVLVTEPDTGDTLTFVLSGTGHELFTVARAGGGAQLRVAAGAALDHESTASYTLTVTVTDGKDAAGRADRAVDDSITVTVTVNDVNDPGVVTLSSLAPQVGTPLTARLADSDGGVKSVTWSWARDASRSGSFSETITGAVQASYTPVAADAGKWLRATAGYIDSMGSATAHATTTAATTSLPVLRLTLTPAAIDESGANNVAAVTATLHRWSLSDTVVDISTAPVLPATAGDFSVSSNKTLRIPAGNTASTGTVTITATDNSVESASKQVTVSGTVTTGDVAGPESVTLRIDDDEAPTVTLHLSPSSVGERAGTATVTASLDEASSASTTVRVSAAPGASAAATDFVLSDSADLTIAAGETTSTGTVTVTAVDNGRKGPDKAVTVSGDVIRGFAHDPADVTLTITDNDTSCAGTTATPAATSSAGLVADCEILLASIAIMRGTTASPNWSTGLAIDQWEGVTVSGGRVTGLEISGMERSAGKFNGPIPGDAGRPVGPHRAEHPQPPAHRRHTRRAGQAVEPDPAVADREPAHRRHTPRAGPAVEPAEPVAGAQRPQRPDPGRAGQADQGAYPGAVQQPPHGDGRAGAVGRGQPGHQRRRGRRGRRCHGDRHAGRRRRLGQQHCGPGLDRVGVGFGDRRRGRGGLRPGQRLRHRHRQGQLPRHRQLHAHTHRRHRPRDRRDGHREGQRRHPQRRRRPGHRDQPAGRGPCADHHHHRRRPDQRGARLRRRRDRHPPGGGELGRGDQRRRGPGGHRPRQRRHPDLRPLPGNSPFAIDGNGQITVADSGALDYEAARRHTVTATVSDGKNDDGEAETPPTADDTIVVTIDVTDADDPGVVSLDQPMPAVGVPVAASLSDQDTPTGTVGWAWTRLDSAAAATGTAIAGATAATYTPVAADRGKWLRATASYADGHGTGKTASAVTAAEVGRYGLTVTPGTIRQSDFAGGATKTVTLTLTGTNSAGHRLRFAGAGDRGYFDSEHRPGHPLRPRIPLPGRRTSRADGRQGAEALLHQPIRIHLLQGRDRQRGPDAGPHRRPVRALLRDRRAGRPRAAHLRPRRAARRREPWQTAGASAPWREGATTSTPAAARRR